MELLWNVVLFASFSHVLYWTVEASEGVTMNSKNTSTDHFEYFKVVNWRFANLKTYFIYTIFIIIVVLMKIVYFHIPKLSSYIPESCILVVIGVIFGVIVKFSVLDEMQYFKLSTNLFFSVFLPPIILESCYSLYHRNFVDNIWSILVLAIFGTLLNILIIGLSLWGLSKFGAMFSLNLTLIHCLLFSSLIMTVDPVAVLAMFSDVEIKSDLYYLVLGESLFNDAVTVVMYEMMQEFAVMREIGGINIFLGFISFFTVSLGGMIIGILIGLMSCLIIRLMVNENTALLEPILLMSTCYMSYLCGEALNWSGIFSMIACGLIQSGYAFFGIQEKSRLVLKRFVKILAAICEALIFLFLGVELVVGKLQWNTSFSLTALALCLVTRFIVTFVLSGLINKVHISLRNIPLNEKIVISFGGLRGAEAFCLAILLKPEVFPATGISGEIIVTTTLFIILFTIFVQGIAVKPMMNLLKIASKKEDVKLSLLDKLNDSVIKSSVAGINAILSKCGRNFILMSFERFNDKYLRPTFQGSSSTSYHKMVAINSKINRAMISELSNPGSNHTLMSQLPNSYANLMGLLTMRRNHRKSTPVRKKSSTNRERSREKPQDNIFFTIGPSSDDEDRQISPQPTSDSSQNVPIITGTKRRPLTSEQIHRELNRKLYSKKSVESGDEGTCSTNTSKNNHKKYSFASIV